MLFVIKHKNVKIPSYPRIYENVYTNLKQIFLVRVYWFKYIFRIKFKFPILDLMLLPKTSVPFEGLNSSSSKFTAGSKIAANLTVYRCSKIVVNLTVFAAAKLLLTCPFLAAVKLLLT